MVSDRGDILAQNAMARALHGDVSTRPEAEHNIVWRYFTDPTARELFPAEDRDHAGRAAVADLRATLARRPDDARLAGLVRRLRARSEEFSALWDAHHVAVRRTDVKRFLHPVVGLLELDCEVLLNPEHDQRLIVYTARPGSRSYERLELLRVVGLRTSPGTPSRAGTAACPPRVAAGSADHRSARHGARLIGRRRRSGGPGARRRR